MAQPFWWARIASESRLDNDPAGHVRVQGAEIIIDAGRGEGERKRVASVEHLRPKDLSVLIHHVVRYIIMVHPGYRGARLDGQELGREGKIVDGYGAVGSCVRGQADARCEDDRKNQEGREEGTEDFPGVLSAASATRRTRMERVRSPMALCLSFVQGGLTGTEGAVDDSEALAALPDVHARNSEKASQLVSRDFRRSRR